MSVAVSFIVIALERCESRVCGGSQKIKRMMYVEKMNWIMNSSVNPARVVTC